MGNVAFDEMTINVGFAPAATDDILDYLLGKTAVQPDGADSNRDSSVDIGDVITSNELAY